MLADQADDLVAVETIEQEAAQIARYVTAVS